MAFPLHFTSSLSMLCSPELGKQGLRRADSHPCGDEPWEGMLLDPTLRRHPDDRTDPGHQPGRNHPGTPGEIKSECWARSSRIRGRLLPESALFRNAGAAGEIEVYPGVHHGFAFPQRWCYGKPAAERHWERLISLYRRRLG
jgi:hypothetical protein